MKLTFLGTGNAGGLPAYGCRCPACQRARQHPELRRGPCSALLETDGESTLIDAGLPDLANRFPPGSFDRILLTHYHMDHVQGLFHIRWGADLSIPVLGPEDPEGCGDLFEHPGILDFSKRMAPLTAQQLGAVRVTPVPLNHSKPTLGYCFEQGSERLAYLTDTLGLPSLTEDFLRQWKPQQLILDCSFPPREYPTGNHNDLSTALAIHEALQPEQTWLTHLDHSLDAWLHSHGATLPEQVAPAQDGLTLELIH